MELISSQDAVINLWTYGEREASDIDSPKQFICKTLNFQKKIAISCYMFFPNIFIVVIDINKILFVDYSSVSEQ